MKKKFVILLALVGLTLFAALANKIDDYFFDDQVIMPSVRQERIEIEKTSLPAGFVQAGELVAESEWGKINVSEIQGISQSETHWFISTKWEMFKVSRDSFPRVDAHIHLLSLRKMLKGGWYCHFGGLAYHDGLIYVATTGKLHSLTKKRAASIMVVLNANLEFVKYGVVPPEVQQSAAWAGFNPVTEHLYSTNGYQELLEYDPAFENGDTLKLIKSHKMHYNTSSDNWTNVVSQGGAFSSAGKLYYVIDKKDADNDDFTGIHGFEPRDDGYHEFEIPGVNNKGENANFIGIKYVGKGQNDRLWEMEDLTIVEESEYEFIYHLQLHNGRTDFARVVRYRLERS